MAFSKDYFIRKAKKGDEKLIYNLIKDCSKTKEWQYTGKKKYNKGYFKHLKNILQNNKSEQKYFLAFKKEDNNKIIGYVSSSYKKNSRLGHRIELSYGVNPKHQNKGIGTLLLKTAIQDAQKKGFKRAEAEVAVENIPSLKIALKNKFKIEGRKKKAFMTDDGRYIDTYVLGYIIN